MTKCAQKACVGLWETIYDPRELSEISTAGLGIGRGVTYSLHPKINFVLPLFDSYNSQYICFIYVFRFIIIYWNIDIKIER
jgi:hypothetical protein